MQGKSSPQGLEIGKNTLKLFFNNPGFLIKPEGAPDPIILRLDLKKKRSSSTQLSGSTSELAAAAADDLAKNEDSSVPADEQPGETGLKYFSSAGFF